MEEKLLSIIEEYKGDDEYMSELFASQNSFTLRWPALKKSLTIDRISLKAREHAILANLKAEKIYEKVHGFLGILTIYGQSHLVLALDREKVCAMPTYK